ncbi:MAG: Gfo/Idh/MocA family oxidoreductase [Actinomycetota bacterium]|nr:Gfo/Idh/MocA family oxidoreductase [Actinomycetota bacterium]
MAGFPTLEDTESPVRVLLVGAGEMGKRWLETVRQSPDTELVGLVDLDLGAAQEALRVAGAPEVPVGTRVADLAGHSRAQAVINVTVPQAHHAVTTEALFHGLPVLSEKPLAPTVSQGLSLAAAAEATGQLLMVSQSRRYYRRLAEFKRSVAALGRVGLVTTEFFKAPHFGGFRDEMEHPLLVDMAIHPFDVARYLLDAEPVAVYCEEFNPSWSWYAGAAAATAVFELTGGIRYVYTGSWCSDGLQTSWNGSWRVSGEAGTVIWEGEDEPRADIVTGKALPIDVPSGPDTPEDIAGSLAEFVASLRTGTLPSGVAHRNLLSLAMVEAAVTSAETKRRVAIADVLAAALATAIENERVDSVRDVLERMAAAADTLDALARRLLGARLE